MNAGDRQSEKERIAKLRELMSDADLARLDAQFKIDPTALSSDEVEVLYLVTRKKILGFEESARRKKEREGGPDDPNSPK